MAEQGEHGIAWTDQTWNPLRGCSKVSEGCRNCYAMSVAARFSGPGQPYEGLAHRVGGKAQWTNKIALVEEHLTDPLRWKKPRRVFVNSMSDLFHEAVPDEFIDRVFAVMALSPQHTFQVLTKRPERMRDYMHRLDRNQGYEAAVILGEAAVEFMSEMQEQFYDSDSVGFPQYWPLPNVWLGVSVEDQKTADARIPFLLETPAAIRWVSYEPALEQVDFSRFLWPTCWHWEAGYGSPQAAIEAGAWAEKKPQSLVLAERTFLDWIVVGGESGHDARPFDVGWARQAVRHCRESATPVFVKQLGAIPVDAGAAGPMCSFMPYDIVIDDGGPRHGESILQSLLRLKDRKGGDMEEWPRDLRVREWPKMR